MPDESLPRRPAIACYEPFLNVGNDYSPSGAGFTYIKQPTASFGILHISFYIRLGKSSHGR